MDFENVKTLIADTLACDADKIKPETKLVEDLEIDSLSLVELHMALEDATGKTIPDGDIGKLCTVQDIVDYLK